MAEKSIQVINKPVSIEISDGEILILIAINNPIELSPASSVLPKTSTMEHLPLIDTTYFQHQIDLLGQELEKYVTANNDFKNFINKKFADERVTQLKFYMKELASLKRKTSALKQKLKISKR